MRLFLNKIIFQKITAYLILLLSLYLLRDFLLVIFLTFVLSFLFLSLGRFIKKELDDRVLEKIFKDKKSLKRVKKIFSLNAIIITLYIGSTLLLIYALSNLLPNLIKEFSEIAKYIPSLEDTITNINSKLTDIRNLNTEIGSNINEVISKQDIDVFLALIPRIKAFGSIFLQIIISIIISLVFIIDRKKLAKYLQKIEYSNFGFLYKEYVIIVDKIVRSFGTVFKAQSLIALINTGLTILGLYIIGLLNGGAFPYVFAFRVIVFICGFIPVFGVFISSIPIAIIGVMTFGNIGVLLELIMLIGLIHRFEAYFLNPKVLSSYIHLPISLTLLVLLLSEHFMGFVGLVMGISVFYFTLDILKDINDIISKAKIILEDSSEVQTETKEKLLAIKGDQEKIL